MLIPKTKHNYVGIEIECIVPDHSTHSLKHAFDRAGLGKYVDVTTDSSIDIECANDHTDECWYECTCPLLDAEVRVLAKETEFKKVIDQVTRLLIREGAYVNESCGLHVHLDMRQRKPEECALRLLRQQEVMLEMQPNHRKDGGYCDAVPIENQMAMFYNWITNAYPSKYAAVNTLSYQRLKTIEVRVAAGTLNSSEIKDWVKWLLCVVDNKSISKWEEEYVQRRIERYSTQHQSFNGAVRR